MGEETINLMRLFVVDKTADSSPLAIVNAVVMYVEQVLF
jgi:hypothetical protein